MKKVYGILIGVVLVVTLAVFGYYLTKKFSENSSNKSGENKEIVRPEAPKEMVSLNERVNYFYSGNVVALNKGYANNAEVVWRSGSGEDKYQGKEQISGFWKNFFENTQFLSNDVSNFQSADNKAQAQLSFSLRRGNRDENIKKVYRIELGEGGKIIRETFSDSMDDLVAQEDIAKENENTLVLGAGTIKSINLKNGQIGIQTEFFSEDKSINSVGEIKNFKIVSDIKIIDNTDGEREKLKTDLAVGMKVGFMFDSKTNQVKKIIIENKL